MLEILRQENLDQFPQENTFYWIRWTTGPRDPVQCWSLLPPCSPVNMVPLSSSVAADSFNYQHLCGDHETLCNLLWSCAK